MTATILTVTPGGNITAEVTSAIAGGAVTQVVVDEQDAPGTLIDWLEMVKAEISASAQVWVISRQERLADVLQDGDDTFGAGSRLGISTWDTGSRGTGGLSSEIRFIIVWSTGDSPRDIRVGKTKRTVRRPLTRKGRRERELEFPAGSLSFEADEILSAATYGAVHVSAMTVVDGENWGEVRIRAPFMLDQEGLDAALAEGAKITVDFAGDDTQVVAIESQEAGRPFPSMLSPKLSNVTSSAEAVRVTRDITGRRVRRAVPETLAEMIISAGSRRGEVVLTVGGPCATIPASAAAGHRNVVHVVGNEVSAEVASARLLAAGGKVDVRNIPASEGLGENDE